MIFSLVKMFESESAEELQKFYVLNSWSLHPIPYFLYSPYISIIQSLITKFVFLNENALFFR